MRIKNKRRILQCLFLGSLTYIVYTNCKSAGSDGSDYSKTRELYIYQYIKQDGFIDSVHGDFKPEIDVYCIRTIEKFRTANGTFVIPPDAELELLPNNVIDCLYHSTVDDYENEQSVDHIYKINVHRHKPSTMNGKQIYTSQKRNHNIGGQTITIDAWSDAVKHGSNGHDILIIDVDQLTERIVDHVINSGVLNFIQQLSIRTSYGDPMSGIDYLAALKQLRKIFEAGFRIYWSRPEWSCIISGNKDRTSCVYIDMVYHKCRVSSSYDFTDQHFNNHGHLKIPEDMMLRKLNNLEMLDLYTRYLTSTQIHCKEVIRIGHMTDGGWNVLS
ncbi:unnamed protein product [Mytilus edulis]|uniref:Uncharacterized protein n=1 Tax=Mytilus edulis TaxID=6550 RepID=A0A8S3R3P4_MYTED|nr:unnamed protein product [Mytilus edulis]